MDVDGARVPVDGIDDPDLRDPSGKKQKTGDAITDLAEAVADKAVAKVMKTDAGRQLLARRISEAGGE